MVERTRAHITANYPEVHGKPKAMWLGPSETGLVEFRISGPEEDVLMSRAEHLLAALRAVPGTIEIEQDWETGSSRSRSWSTRRGPARVTSADIATTLNAFVSGGAITDYREGDAVIPIVLRGEEAKNQISRPAAIDVYSSAEGTNVLDPDRRDPKPVETLYDQSAQLERTVTVSATNPQLSANELVGAVMPALESLDLPPGYRWEMGGELENARSRRATSSRTSRSPGS